MLVCRKSSDGETAAGQNRLKRPEGNRKLGEGGPVFFPRRKPSALGERLLGEIAHGAEAPCYQGKAP